MNKMLKTNVSVWDIPCMGTGLDARHKIPGRQTGLAARMGSRPLRLGAFPLTRTKILEEPDLKMSI